LAASVLWPLAPLHAAEPLSAAPSLLLEPTQLPDEPPPGWVILDVRKPAAYAEGHLPGAVNLPVDNTFQPSGRTDQVGGPAYIQDLFGQAGIDHDKRVVIYDDGGFIDAGRMFWVLEVYGHEQARVLNGGFPGWLAAGRAVSRAPVQAEPAVFTALARPEKLVTTLGMRLAVDDAAVTIIDARKSAEYYGRQSITPRYGHIPRAINIPWHDNFATVGGVARIKDAATLAQLYGGLRKDARIITYCNLGKQSSLTYFILRELGYDVAHYDGSWFEWSSDMNLPVVTP
jgi:thiosulfate/3-mercaptopyruvate sulfurtransferase